jgi:hypothetical protein
MISTGGCMGMAMIAGVAFVNDLAFGYPAGAPDGKPDMLSWHGILHGIAFMVTVLFWMAACLVFAHRFAATYGRGWAAYCVAIGLVLVAPIATPAAPPGAVLIFAAAATGWT